jgi:hypothetical protein
VNGSPGEVVAPTTALPRDFVAEAAEQIDRAGQAVLDGADYVLENRMTALAKQLQRGGATPDDATMMALWDVLEQRSKVLVERQELHKALAEYLTEAAKGLDVDARDFAFGVALQFLFAPDKVAVAYVATFVQDIYEEIENFVAFLEGALHWLMAVSFEGATQGLLPDAGVDELMKFAHEHDTLLGWSVPALEDVKSARDASHALGEAVGALIEDPVQSVVDSVGLVVGAVRMLAQQVHEQRTDLSADLLEMRRDPFALGEALGHGSAVVVILAATVFVDPAEVATAAGQAVREAGVAIKAIEESESVLGRAVSASRKLYDSKVEWFHRLWKAIELYRKEREIEKGFHALGPMVKLLARMKDIDAATTRALARLSQEVLPELFLRLRFRVGIYKELRAGNEVFNGKALLSYALTLRSSRMATLAEVEELLAVRQLRQVWLEAAHIVDGRLFEHFAADFKFLGWASAEEMPAYNAMSSTHTASYRSFLDKLFAGKKLPTNVTQEDLIADVKRITDVFNERIVVAKPGVKPPSGVFVVRPGQTKASELLVEVRRVWDAEVKITRLPPRGFEILDESIAKLKAAGR